MVIFENEQYRIEKLGDSVKVVVFNEQSQFNLNGYGQDLRVEIVGPKMAVELDQDGINSTATYLLPVELINFISKNLVGVPNQSQSLN